MGHITDQCMFCFWKNAFTSSKWVLNFLKVITLRCLMRGVGCLLIFRYFPTAWYLIKTLTFINFSKRCQKSNFISIHKGQKTVFISCFAYIGGCLKRSHCIVFMFLGDGLKRHYCIAYCFEVNFISKQIL